MPSTHHPKRQGLKLATSGLLLAVGITVLLDAIHFAEVTPREWIVLVAATAGLLGTVWGLLEVGGHLWHRRDPHFVLTPAVAVMILSCVLIRIAPESRMLVLGIWPVVLIFAAGYLGFRSSGLLSLLMTIGYLGAVWLARVPGIRVEVELLVGGVFLATSLYSAVVLSRLRRQRNELAAARAELTRLALTDPLTGLANRRHFDGVLASELSRTARYEGATSLALVDLDHFKLFNDRHGHPAGDAALSEVAGLLRERVRSHDTVARLGGEEFAVLMVGADPEAAYRTAERIRASVNAREFGPSALRISISVGVATAPENGCTPAELVREADRALYRAKAAGRNTIVVAAVEATRTR